MLSRVKKQKENVEYPTNVPFKFTKNVSQASSIFNANKESDKPSSLKLAERMDKPKIEPGIQYTAKRVALVPKTIVNAIKKNNEPENRQKSLIVNAGIISNSIKHCQKSELSTYGKAAGITDQSTKSQIPNNPPKKLE